jgi:hypothetical protein
VKDKEIRSLEKGLDCFLVSDDGVAADNYSNEALADAMKMLSPKDTVKPSSSIPRLKSPRDTPQVRT